MNKDKLWSTLLQLIEDYHDVTPSSIDIEHGPFDAASFGRIVGRGRPSILKNAFPDLAPERWTTGCLRQRMGDRVVDVAVTPDGLADSIHADTDCFVEPYNTSLAFQRFLSHLETPSAPSTSKAVPSGSIVYLQSQNDNLRTSSSFEPLLPLLPEVPAFATSFFAREPEAMNLWIGSSRSVTSLHRDSSYHNIYTVIRGTKEFTLFSPLEELCLYERPYQHASWTLKGDAEFAVLATEPNTFVPWPSISPFRSAQDQSSEFPLYAHARPLTAFLESGDTLYMPPGWFHAVRQREESGPGNDWTPCIAVNFWFDRDIGDEASQWATQGLIGRLSKMLHRRDEEN